MDLIVKLPLSDSFNSILTVTDHDCSKAAIFIPCHESITVTSIADLYIQHVFPHYGTPRKLITNRDCYDRASWTIIFLSLLSYYCTTDTLPSLLVTVLSWTYSLIPRLGQDASRTVHLLPYLLHVLPLPLLYHLRMHQYLLMCTLRALPMPTSPHCCLMCHGSKGPWLEVSFP